MAYIIFKFNNLELQVEKTDSEVEKIFQNLTNIKILNEINPQKTKLIEENKENFSIEKVKEKKHPSVDELIDFIKSQSNLEFGSELIREKYYPDISNPEWRKTFPNIFQKIQKAIERLEEQEKGKFIKTKVGKYTIYHFEKENIPSLFNYENKTKWIEWYQI